MKKTLFSGFIERLRVNRRLEAAVYAVLVLTAVVIFAATGGVSCGEKAKEDDTPASSLTGASSERELEARLEEILSRINGAGRVRVMVTFEDDGASERTETGTDGLFSYGDKNKNGGTEDTVSHKVRGVIVVAEGAKDLGVKLALQNAVMTVLGAEPASIGVFVMGN